ncbi:hypothetical protein Lal_00019715 [Lupinus albus]|uniref:Putative transcription factor WD40-like family n=1 Tax=Lupinus albus TaxID=3870 RepID=A0A6A4R4E2_LUPAL|nr:putative transcription factor WD40-like family [Lupinus albus]KAF1899587.1 hypothetical protein Lal_00019715 [Lupinus albus]
MSSSFPSSFDEFILTSSPDGPIVAYEASTGATYTHFSHCRSPRRGLTMVNQSLIAVSHVFSDTGAGSVQIYNWHISNVFNNFPLPEPVAPLIATSDGAFLFLGGLSGTIHSLSFPSGNLVNSFSLHSTPISSLHLNHDASLLISGSNDGVIVMIPSFKLVEEGSYSLAEEEDSRDFILHQWKAHSDSITALKSGVGLCRSTLISCSLDCTCKIWDMSNGVLIQTVTFPYAIFGVALDSRESRFYAGGEDGLVYMGSMNREMIKKGYELFTWSKCHNGSIVSLVLVNEGRNLVSAAEDGSVWKWDVMNGEVTMVLGNNNDKRSMISDMIVATRDRNHGVVIKENDVVIGDSEINDLISSSSFSSSRLYDEEVVTNLMQITDFGQVLDVLVEDKKKAINMLESAIEMYERLLKLILKEAMRGISGSNDDEDKEKQGDKEQEEENEN